MSTDPFLYCPHCGSKVELRLLKDGEPQRHVCVGCQTVHFQSPKLAAGVILQHDGKIVLTRRDIEPGRGLWSYPGGFVERGETVPEAAKREALEEVLAEVHLQGLLGVYSYPGSIITVVVYRAKSMGLPPRAGDEVQEVGFFTPEQIPWNELAFSSVKDSLKDYLAWTS